MHASLISIRPRHARGIFSGAKTVELRRRPPQLASGHVLFVYETAPAMTIRGFAIVADVTAGDLGLLWERVGKAAGVSYDEYRAYFRGLGAGVGIHVHTPTEFDTPLTLADVRQHAPLFRPPQSWYSFGALALPIQQLLQAAYTSATTRAPGYRATSFVSRQPAHHPQRVTGGSAPGECRPPPGASSALQRRHG